MISIQQLFSDNLIKNSSKKYKETYSLLKPLFKESIIEIMKGWRTTARGRKCSIDWDNYFDCLFSSCDNATKMSYTYEHYGIPKSTYYHYFEIMTAHKMFEKLYSKLIKSLPPIEYDDYVITDTATIKSMDSSEGCGRNPTDRGRNGIKISLICDQMLVARSVYIGPANIHDSTLFEQTTNHSISNLEGVKCLADSGYAGYKYIEDIKNISGVNLISKPKRTRNPDVMSHTISSENMILLEAKRNGIERLIGNTRSFRSIMIKYTKKISSYKTYLYVALLCISCYNIFAKH
jgi:hypothetical protein